jgi:hypothetical protein
MPSRYWAGCIRNTFSRPLVRDAVFAHHRADSLAHMSATIIAIAVGLVLLLGRNEAQAESVRSFANTEYSWCLSL